MQGRLQRVIVALLAVFIAADLSAGSLCLTQTLQSASCERQGWEADGNPESSAGVCDDSCFCSRTDLRQADRAPGAGVLPLTPDSLLPPSSFVPDGKPASIFHPPKP